MNRSGGPASAALRRATKQSEALNTLDADATVTSILPLPDGSGRASVKVGRVRLGPFSEEDIARSGVSADRSLDPRARETLAGGLRTEAARADALRLLRARARSKRDLVGRLVAKGHSRIDAESAVDRLESARVIDDEALARDRASRLAADGRAGPRGAEVKLRALGIDSRLATVATADAFEGVDLLERAVALAERRAATLPPDLDDISSRRRLYGFLARRGYDPDTCRTAIERALGRAD